MAEILRHRRETRRQTDKANICLNDGKAPAYSPTKFSTNGQSGKENVVRPLFFMAKKTWSVPYSSTSPILQRKRGPSPILLPYSSVPYSSLFFTVPYSSPYSSHSSPGTGGELGRRGEKGSAHCGSAGLGAIGTASRRGRGSLGAATTESILPGLIQRPAIIASSVVQERNSRWVWPGSGRKSHWR
jgi:hypothetical protein